MTRASLDDTFAAGRAAGRALLMPFIVCGYPSDDAFVDIAAACAQNGADVLEIGVPFSDPIMDGPVIQEAAFSVLSRGPRVDAMLSTIDRAQKAAGIPFVLMTYYNVVMQHGLDGFATAAAGHGASGVILPDLSVEESGEWRKSCAQSGIASVFIAAVTSDDGRLRSIGEASEGFVYAASLLGVTGVRSEMSSRAQSLVSRIRAVTELPVAVGIGVSTAQHAAEVASFADGVIVGSALVKRIGEASDAASAAGKFIGELRAGIAGARR